MNQLCRVCGEAAAGFHFGAFTCEGCKSFFGRTYNNAGSLGHCKNGGRCVITKKNRTSCKACRLTKCLAAGMSKSGSRYGRRSNWFKIHCLLQEKASATLSAASNVLSPGCKRSLHHLEDARVKDEDSGTDSPALSSPESQTSEGSGMIPAGLPSRCILSLESCRRFSYTHPHLRPILVYHSIRISPHTAPSPWHPPPPPPSLMTWRRDLTCKPGACCRSGLLSPSPHPSASPSRHPSPPRTQLTCMRVTAASSPALLLPSAGPASHAPTPVDLSCNA
ncbi:hypothetical protein O3P69_019747 [Scylla paramamosain]|uniref:Nuclear receptor domain-containing protein n=1 Tax=Scylla paramamosain TaxID=85552 RepID=A0AAW0SX91_SCYPA